MEEEDVEVDVPQAGVDDGSESSSENTATSESESQSATESQSTDMSETMDEEEEDEDPEPMVYRNFANGYGRRQSAPVRNRDRFDRDLEEYSDQVHDEPREKGVRGLVILACLELLGIAAVIVYWLLFLL